MKVFISYSHHDTGVLDRLHVHLATMRKDGLIDTWYDREILAGDVLDNEISDELETSDVIVLLVSPDFLASDYCVDREMVRALELHESEKARVVPIIIEPCDWKSIEVLRRLKALPRDGKPISDWTNANTAFLDIVQELRRIASFEKTDNSFAFEPEVNETPSVKNTPNYRVKRDFDEIDRSEFLETAFSVIKNYFLDAAKEIDQVEGLRGRFVDRGPSSFGCTVVNRERSHGTAHITVHMRNGQFSLADIYYSFNEDARDNSMNGGFSVSADEYELFLEAAMMQFHEAPDRMTAEDAAEQLWKLFVEQAGITYD